MSECLPHLAGVVDDLTFVRSVATDVFNHAPAKLFANTGSSQFGRPSMGSWVTYGIGSESDSLPGFVVLQSGPRGPRGGAVNWGERLPALGLPGRSAPVRRRSDPQPGHARRASRTASQRRTIDAISRAEPGPARRDRRPRDRHQDHGLRDRLPDAVERAGADRPGLRDAPTRCELYGAEPGKPSFANNCLLARRLVERGVRFVQLYHTDWDHHGVPGQTLPSDLDTVCRDIDQPCAALIRDLKIARPARLDAGGLGRRVRPHADGRDPRVDRPQSPHRRHDHVVRRRRGEGRPDARRDRRVRLCPDRRTASTSTTSRRPSSTCWAWTTSGSTFRFQGRDFRLTDVGGNVVAKMLA